MKAKLVDADRYSFTHGGLFAKLLWLFAPRYATRRYMRKLVNRAYWDRRLLWMMRENHQREYRRRVRPEGTERKVYQPLPGDLVDVDCTRLRPALGVHGTRLATVERPTQAHGNDLAWVRLPGFEGLELVDADALTLVWRRPVP